MRPDRSPFLLIYHMIARSFTTRTVCVLAAAVVLAGLSGCCDGPCPDTAHPTRAATPDGKDMGNGPQHQKDVRYRTSGPHQGG